MGSKEILEYVLEDAEPGTLLWKLSDRDLAESVEMGCICGRSDDPS